MRKIIRFQEGFRRVTTSPIYLREIQGESIVVYPCPYCYDGAAWVVVDKIYYHCYGPIIIKESE